jgi:phosphoserine phosphatase RsbU/P
MRNQILSIKKDSSESFGQALAEVMAQLNQQVYQNSPAEKYATLFLSRYDADARRLWYCNAGHPSPILLNGDGIKALRTTGMAVGMFPDVVYQSESVELPPGALLAIFTDGATETMNESNEEFGEKRLIEALQQSRARMPQDIWEYAIASIHRWQGSLPQSDDITLIVSKVDNLPSTNL